MTNAIALRLLGVVDGVLFLNDDREATLQQTWSDLGLTVTDLHRICRTIEKEFGFLPDRGDQGLFKPGLTLAEAADEIAKRSEVLA